MNAEVQRVVVSWWGMGRNNSGSMGMGASKVLVTFYSLAWVIGSWVFILLLFVKCTYTFYALFCTCDTFYI